MPASNSTIVRTTNSAGDFRPPLALRAGLRGLAALTPRGATAVAERLFLTPLRHAAPPREREALATGRHFDVPFNDGRLRAWRFGAGPTVALLHGWSGRGGQLTAFVAPLVEAGFAVVTFDAPAHGRSSGRTASVPAFAAALQAVAAHVGGVRAAIAHSMGAPSITLALIAGLHLDAAVFVGPPRSPAEPFRRFCAALELPAAVREGVRGRLEARFGMPIEEFDVPRLARAFTTPLLVVHDRGDAEVAWSEGAAIAEAWPGAQLVTTAGLGHRRILREPEVLARVAAFVREHVPVPACSCGRPVNTSAAGPVRCGACALAAELYDPSTRWVLAT